MTQWLPLDSREFTEPQQRRFGEATVNIVLSPYDIPDAVRSMYDHDRRTWLVEFKYFGEPEPRRSVDQNEGIVVKVGRHSGRLYSVEIPNTDGPGSVRFFEPKVDEAIAELKGRQTAWRRLANYEVARKIVSARRDDLFTARESAPAS